VINVSARNPFQPGALPHSPKQIPQTDEFIAARDADNQST
jgi:hypothetical protein